MGKLHVTDTNHGWVMGHFTSVRSTVFNIDFSLFFTGCIQWLSDIAMFTQGASGMCHCYDSKWHVSNNFLSIDSAWTNYKKKKTVLKETVVSFQGKL